MPTSTRAPGPLKSAYRQADTRSGAWSGVPLLQDGAITLREISHDDAGPLARHLSDPALAIHSSPAPQSAEGFQQFARWARERRFSGDGVCFVVIPAGDTDPVGVVQIWPIDTNWSTAEWGIAIGRTYWGTGVAMHAARLAIGFAFSQLGTARLEARTAAGNVRANRFLAKVGATAEARLRSGSTSASGRTDSFLWSILAAEYVDDCGVAPVHVMR